VRFENRPGHNVLYRVPAAKFPGRVLRRYYTGQMVVAQNNELRDMMTEIRLIRDDGTHTKMNGLPFLTDTDLASPQDLEPVTITYVAPKKYPTGTLTFEHTFPDNGKFIGIVTVKDAHGQTYVSQFPFSVGQPLGKSIGMYGLVGGAMIVALFSFWQYNRRQPSALPKNPA
jgi:hypothetical protein